MNFGPYAKAVNGTVLALLGAVIIALGDNNVITPQEWAGIAATTIAAGVAIVAVKNGGRFGPYAKAIMAALIPALGVLATGLDGSGDAGWYGLTLVEGLGALAMLLNGIVVGNTPNAQESDNLIVHDTTDGEHRFDEGGQPVNP